MLMKIAFCDVCAVREKILSQATYKHKLIDRGTNLSVSVHICRKHKGVKLTFEEAKELVKPENQIAIMELFDSVMPK